MIQTHRARAEIRIEEISAQTHNAEYSYYEVSENLSLKTVAFSDGYASVHRTLEQAGKLNHSFENCPERNKPKTVRVWTPKSGWTDVRVPWAVPQR